MAFADDARRTAALASGNMRGFTKTLAMLGLAGGLAIVPAIGSQGAGALGDNHVYADSHLLSPSAEASSLVAADRLVERQVLELTRR